VIEYQDFLKNFLQHERFLAAYLLSATGDIHAAEDLLQNVACALWRKRDDYDPGRPFRAWATGMAQIEVLRWRQRLARSREVFSKETMQRLAETVERRAEAIDERYQYLAECVQALAGAARGVVQMKYGESHSIGEIASQLKKSVPAVEMILVRSRRALRDCVDRKVLQARRGAL
jgi:RNA polymerase sigma-70 factor (ECF subfamily)